MAKSSDPKPAASPEVRLNQLLRSNACIPYFENIPDKEFPQIKYSVYGAPKTNEVFVRISNSNLAYVGVALSNLIYPAMRDRVFGIDVSDEKTANELGLQLWEKHQDELLKKSPEGEGA